MEVINLFQHLDTIGTDEKTGIKIDRMCGDDRFSLYVGEIFPHTWLKPHYHHHGMEIYQIIEGSGVMKTGTRKGDQVIWEEETPVSKGDCFTIPEDNVHQLGNNTDKRLIACFTCSPSHLGDDRYFMEIV